MKPKFKELQEQLKVINAEIDKLQAKDIPVSYYIGMKASFWGSRSDRVEALTELRNTILSEMMEHIAENGSRHRCTIL